MEQKSLFMPKILVFAIIFLTSSFTVTNDIISSAATIVLWLMVALVLFLGYSNNYIKYICYSAVLVLFMWFTTLINGESIWRAMANTFAFFVAGMYVDCYGFEEFKEAYIKVIKFLCIISLIGFAIYRIFPSFNSFFTVQNAVGANYSNLFVYVNSPNLNRNLGMFWEPGAFQTFIAIALLFEIIKPQFNTKIIYLFVITMVTTFSTVAYISLAVVFLIALSNRKKIKSNILGIALVCVIGLLIFIYFNQDLFFATNKSTVFGKIISFFDGGHQNSNDVTSASVRYNAIFKVIGAFFKSPIFGLGITGLTNEVYRYTHGMNTCTFANWFAVYGVFFGSFMMLGYGKLSSKLSNSNIQKILIFTFFFIVTMAENFASNATFILLALYGLKRDNYYNTVPKENI